MKNFRSDISGKEFPVSQKVHGSTLNEGLLTLIKRERPSFNEHQILSVSELKKFKQKYITDHLISQTGEISESEKAVLDSISGDTILADIIEDEDKKPITLGQKVADKVASFGGSWTFILSFLAFLLIWIAINVFVLVSKKFDPYPFILLNLILSCLAALQAPVIMMSQNRQEEKDRERAKKDYMINLKAELEIKALHEKIDHLLAVHRTLLEQQSDNDADLLK